MGRAGRRAMTLILGALLLMALAPVAGASADPYPPSQCSTVTVSRTSVVPGDTVAVGGAGFRAGADVSVRLDPETIDAVLGRGPVRADGTFSMAVTVPAVRPGTHKVVPTGPLAKGCRTPPAPALLGVDAARSQRTSPAVAPAAVGGAGAGSGTGAGAAGLLSSTGFDVALIVVMGLALAAAGTLLLGGERAGRRRRVLARLL